ncbi:MAG: amidohydrolase family protein [Acidobacteriota bacterium]
MQSTRAIAIAAFMGGTLVAGGFRATAQEPAPVTYAITGARIVPVAGATVDRGTVVFRDGVITAVGASVAVPTGAVVIEGKGLTVYPGLVDLGSAAGLEAPAAPQDGAPQTTEDVERRKRALLLRPHVRASDGVNPGAQALSRAAAAGITTVLAVPPGEVFRGQSALVLTSAGPDAPQVGAVADDRRRPIVVKSPVALHVAMPDRPGGGNAYPNSLMGVIAFVRQTFLDAQHHQASLEHAAKHNRPAPAPDAAFDALQPALAGRLPVAFEAETAREIRRALDMAAAFRLTPIVTNAREADTVTSELKAAGARVILSLNYPRRPESLAPDADESLATLRARANAPKTAAALEKAGVWFGFASNGLSDPKDFVKNAAKAVQHGLSRDAAVRALTLGAATLAGVADRVGSIEAGKLANLLVVEGDLFDEKMAVRHVFVNGKPVTLDAPAAQPRRGGN